jgi:hypothetical protein
MKDETPEGRNATVAAAISEGDKWRVQLVARKEGRSLSDLLYDNSLNELIARGKRLEAALEEAA